MSKKLIGELELNRIYQRDCIEGMRMLPDDSVDFVLTDPPYNIGFKPQRKLKGEDSYARNGIHNDKMDEGDFMAWLDDVCAEIDRTLKPNSYVFMFCGWPTIHQFQPVLQKYWTVKALHIWKKNVFGIGYYSRPQYEPFFMCMKGKPPKPEKAPFDVWEYRKVYRSKARPYVHSCQKPLELLDAVINTYATDAQIILDPFAGSASTAVSATRCGKDFVTFELEREYIEVGNRRLDDEFTEISEIKESGER